jgi:fibro-slime domain-containing protein
MSLPWQLACRLRGLHVLGLALVPALALTVAGCAAVREGPSASGADAAMDFPVTGGGARDAFAETTPRGSTVDAPSDHMEPRGDGGPECTDAGNCLIGCGNGKLDPGLGEACDDGNGLSGDGCGANCATIEKDYTCPQPGVACVYLVKCGDGRLGGKETCDDGNVASNDGCSATCTGEPGWDCGTPGLACTPHCGDGVLKAAEQCEPPNPGKGCSAGCKVEPGYVCAAPPATPNPTAPATCHKSVCGDGVKEGAEACDDKNVIDGDGCAATCTLEPDCSTGLCASKCGDGLKLAPEGCDDGNVVDGDGCAKACTLEMGYTCTDSSGEPPARLNLAVTYRDFISFPTGGSTKHPDFERFWGDDVTPLLVKPALGPTGKPVMDGRCVAPGQTAICPKGQELTTMANFDQWYNDVATVNINIPGAILLPRQANGSYVYDSANVGFYPIDKKGWTAAPIRENTAIAEAGVNDGLAHNFGFTTEIRYFFQYRGGESLTFSGDDDVWIFVNRRLALDLGGLHPPIEKTLDVDASAAALGLTVGGLYEVVLFHAERHTAGSNFKLTLTGFAPTSSTCGPRCGDAVVVAPEQCDLGTDMNTGQYNGCTAECRRGPSCGDATVQMPDEQCDDGVNLTLYGMAGAPGCAPGCVHSGYCGDAKVDGVFGEQCDLGTEMNTGQYAGCLPTCLLGPRCGDKILQKDAGEECDDGNTVGGDGCAHDCKIEYIP